MFKNVCSLIFSKHGEWSEKKREKKRKKIKEKYTTCLKEEKVKKKSCHQQNHKLTSHYQQLEKELRFSVKWGGVYQLRMAWCPWVWCVLHFPLWLNSVTSGSRDQSGAETICTTFRQKLKDERKRYKIITIARKKQTLCWEKTLIKSLSYKLCHLPWNKMPHYFPNKF